MMHVANAASVLTMVANIILDILYVPKGSLWFAFFFSFIGGAVQPMIIVSLSCRSKCT
jgi:ACS family pantothenate transporter-like MFS transporter